MYLNSPSMSLFFVLLTSLLVSTAIYTDRYLKCIVSEWMASYSINQHNTSSSMLKLLDISLSIKPRACDPCEYRKSVPLKVLPPPSHSQPPFSHVPILYLLSHSWFLVPSSWDLAMCVCLCVCKDVWLYLAPSQHFQAALMPLASNSSQTGTQQETHCSAVTKHCLWWPGGSRQNENKKKDNALIYAAIIFHDPREHWARRDGEHGGSWGGECFKVSEAKPFQIQSHRGVLSYTILGSLFKEWERCSRSLADGEQMFFWGGVAQDLVLLRAPATGWPAADGRDNKRQTNSLWQNMAADSGAWCNVVGGKWSYASSHLLQ